MGGYDEIGRHAGFRFLCRKACGFESRYPYQSSTGFNKESVELIIILKEPWEIIIQKLMKGF